MSNEGYVSENEIFPKVIGARKGEIKMAFGVHTTVAAVDTLVTGLAEVVSCVVSKNDDPVDGAMYVTADIGDQAGTPAAGSVLINSWLNTDGDSTHVVATTHTKDVAWVAFGY